jgi:predicted nucleotidyltransferase
LEQINPIDEEHGILEIEYIKQKCSLVFEKYDVSFCYLFGSYAKGKAEPTSDVDFLISADVRGLEFYGLVEEIRTALHKRVDVLDIHQLRDNLDLTQEILKDGIKIYG